MSITSFQARLLNIEKKKDYLYLFFIGCFPLIFSYIIGIHRSIELYKQGELKYTYRGYWESWNWFFFFLLLPLALYLLRYIANNLFCISPRSSPILKYFEGRRDEVKSFIKSRLKKIALDQRIPICILFLDTIIHIFERFQSALSYTRYFKNPGYAPSVDKTLNRVELDWEIFFTIENFAKENLLQALNQQDIPSVNIYLNLLFTVYAYFCQFIIVFIALTLVVLILRYNLFYLQLIYQRKRVSEERIEYHIVLNLNDPDYRFGLASMDDGFNLQIIILCVSGLLMWASRYMNVSPEYYSLALVAKKIVKLPWPNVTAVEVFDILSKIPFNKLLLPDRGQILLVLGWLIEFFIVLLPSFAKFLPCLYVPHKLTPTNQEYLREFIPPKDEENKYKLDTKENLSETRKQFKNNDFWPIGDQYASLFFCFVFFVALSLLIPLNFNLKEWSNLINLIFVISISVVLSCLLLKGLKCWESFLLPELIMEDKPVSEEYRKSIPMSMKKRILILSANPKNTTRLRVDEEMREIKEGLKRAKQREDFVIETGQAVRYRDIRRAILDCEPNIVHFSGHGGGEEGLAFEDETGQVKLVKAEALANLFKLFSEKIECVVLNACYSKVQAKAIAQYIPYVVGMNKSIGDKAAIEFAVGFYDALGAGRSVEFAYELGCNSIEIAGIPEHLIPQLLSNSNNSSC